MAVKIVKREYTDLYRPNEVLDWLLGNVGDWQTLKLTCEVSAEIIGTNSESISINTEEQQITLNSGKNWGEFGFDIGDTAFLRYKRTTVDPQTQDETEEDVIVQFNIVLILGDTVEYSGGAGFDDIDYALIPTDRGTERITNVRIYTDKDFEGCKIILGHITNANSDSDNLNSFIDGTKAELIYAGLNNLPFGNTANMEAVGLQSGMSIRSSRVRRVDLDDENVFAEWFIQPGAEQSLLIFDAIILNPEFRAIRTATAGLLDGANAPQGYQDQSTAGIDNLIPQGTNPTPNNNFNGQLAFIRNAPGPSYTQQFSFGINIVVTDTLRLNPGDGSYVQLVILKYTNDTSDFVERIVLQRWDDPSTIVNQILTFQGIRELQVNPTDSFVLCTEFFRPGPYNNDPRALTYRWVSGGWKAGQPNETLDETAVKTYEIEIDYQIASFFDVVENIDNVEAPGYLIGDGSLTDNFDIRFFPEWNNPNTIVSNDLSETRRLGNTGWFNENFNQLDNDFLVESVIYRDVDGNVVQDLDYLSPTLVEITVSGVPNLGSNSRFGFGFMWIPTNEEDYKENEFPHYQNTFVSNGPYDASFPLSNTPDATTYFGAGINGASMDVSDVQFRQVGSNVVFTARFTPNGAFGVAFEAKDDDRKYILWVSVADGNIDQRNFSDRVSLLADVGDLVKNIPPAGPYPMTTKFIEHPFLTNHPGVDIYSGVTQDDILARSRFSINLDNNTVFQQMTFALEMENSETGQIFELESYDVDLSQSPIDTTGLQVFDFDAIRGFKLNDGNNKNLVKVSVFLGGAITTGVQQTYQALYAFKIRYEDWLQRANVPSDFFDTGEENNGQNNDWYDYINTPGNWRFKYTVYILATVDGENVLYRNPHDLEFADYDQNEQVATAVRYIRDEDDTVLNVGNDPDTGNPLGVILQNEFTRIEQDFVIQDSGTWVAGNVYGVTTIEIDRGAGIFEMRQLSSVWESEGDNPLIPVEGETKLKLEIDGTGKKLTTTCLVDPELLQDAIRYRITGRVGCFEDGDAIDDGGVYESAYEPAYQ